MASITTSVLHWKDITVKHRFPKFLTAMAAVRDARSNPNLRLREQSAERMCAVFAAVWERSFTFELLEMGCNITAKFDSEEEAVHFRLKYL